MSILWKCLTLGLVVSGSVQAMEAVDPFKESLAKQGISVHKEEIYPGVSVHVMEPFPEAQKNRNHFDERRVGSEIKQFGFLYTVVDTKGTMKIFTENKKVGNVSTHYAITQEEPGMPGGQIIQIVREEKRAWGLGFSAWGEDTNLSHTSITCSLVNKGFDDNNDGSRTYYGFDEDQVKAAVSLVKPIVKKYKIQPLDVILHEDSAPGRVYNYAFSYPLKYFYENGVGAGLAKEELDPEHIMKTYNPKTKAPTEIDNKILEENLKRIGYAIGVTPPGQEVYTITYKNALRAFKAHYSENQGFVQRKGMKMSLVIENQKEQDIQNTTATKNDMYWAWALLAKYKPEALEE